MPASREDWERVGALLIDRRIEISPRYANRRVFAEETSLNWRMLHDAEHGKRATFKPETVRAFETAYRLVPGSLRRSLDGGPLEPAAEPARPLAPLRAAVPFPAAGTAKYEVADKLLTWLLDRYKGNEVVRAMGAQRGTDAGIRVVEILRFLKDPELDREVLAWLLSLGLDDDAARVLKALGAQGGKRELMRITEILEFLGWRPPEMEARNGTAGLTAPEEFAKI